MPTRRNRAGAPEGICKSVRDRGPRVRAEYFGLGTLDMSGTVS